MASRAVTPAKPVRQTDAEWRAGLRRTGGSAFKAGASAGDVGKYTVQWVFTRPNALSQVLESADAPSFALATGERLSLAGVSVEVKPKAA